MTSLHVKKVGIQWCYSWNDNYGLHQYYCDAPMNQEVGKIVDFKTSNKDKYVFYSWNDNLGFHTYYLDL